MPRLSVEDASAACAAMAYALSTLPRDAPKRVDWERVLHRLQQRLDVAQSQHAQRRARQYQHLDGQGACIARVSANASAVRIEGGQLLARTTG